MKAMSIGNQDENWDVTLNIRDLDPSRDKIERNDLTY